MISTVVAPSIVVQWRYMVEPAVVKKVGEASEKKTLKKL